MYADLSDDSVATDLGLQSYIERFVLEPVATAADPLFAIQLLHFTNEHHVRLVGFEHLIADGLSLQIVLRDLLVGYQQEMAGSHG